MHVQADVSQKRKNKQDPTELQTVRCSGIPTVILTSLYSHIYKPNQRQSERKHNVSEYKHFEQGKKKKEAVFILLTEACRKGLTSKRAGGSHVSGKQR